VRAGDDTEDEGDSGAVKKDRHAAAVAPSALRGIAGDAKRATLHLTLPLAGTPLQVPCILLTSAASAVPWRVLAPLVFVERDGRREIRRRDLRALCECQSFRR